MPYSLKPTLISVGSLCLSTVPSRCIFLQRPYSLFLAHLKLQITNNTVCFYVEFAFGIYLELFFLHCNGRSVGIGGCGGSIPTAGTGYQNRQVSLRTVHKVSSI
jgi:hypothetical protein